MIGNVTKNLNLLAIFILVFVMLSVAVLFSYNSLAVSGDKLYDEYNVKNEVTESSENIFIIGLEITSSIKLIFIIFILGSVILGFLVTNKDSFLPAFQRILSALGRN